MIDFLFYLSAIAFIFLLSLMLIDAKAFTLHLCFADRKYWRFERLVTKPNKHDTIHTFMMGPVSFVVVR